MLLYFSVVINSNSRHYERIRYQLSIQVSVVCFLISKLSQKKLTHGDASLAQQSATHYTDRLSSMRMCSVSQRIWRCSTQIPQTWLVESAHPTQTLCQSSRYSTNTHPSHKSTIHPLGQHHPGIKAPCAPTAVMAMFSASFSTIQTLRGAFTMF